MLPLDLPHKNPSFSGEIPGFKLWIPAVRLRGLVVLVWAAFRGCPHSIPSTRNKVGTFCRNGNEKQKAMEHHHLHIYRGFTIENHHL